MKLPTAQHAAARGETFGFTCHACSRCCHHKKIQTNPYEIAVMADHLGMSTSEFRARWTQDGEGTALSQTDEGACVFLGERGCTIHPARPLVCRLYPLGRHRSGEGSESWVRVEPHPQSLGEFTMEGTIADYLAQQGAQPFIEAADAYVDWVNAALGSLAAAAESGSAGVAEDLLDMDPAIAGYCGEHGIVPPQTLDERRELHLQILYEELAGLEGAGDGRK